METTDRKKKTNKLTLKHLSWLTDKRSSLLLNDKIFVYKDTIITTWAYGIALWGFTRIVNINQSCR